MRATAALIAILLSCALAMPLNIPHKLLTGDPTPNPNWIAAANSTVTCSSTTSKIVVLAGPQLETVLNDACAAMMPACAYPQRLGPDTFCVQTIDFSLSEERCTVQSVDGGELHFSVVPAQTESTTSAGAFWTKADCYGYFAQIISEKEPVGCLGSSFKSVTVGGTGSLNGTVFSVELVEGV